jgi:murein L,D-transpeptidase YafK
MFSTFLKIFFVFFILIQGISLAQSNNFTSEQKKYSRVRVAYSEKDSLIKEDIKKLNLSLNEIHVLFIAYKQEKELELWIKRKSDKKYNLMNNYQICRTSGQLGPKRREGDLQIPEGFYYINVFNPVSNFYLSMGINYPNRSDRILSPYQNPGSAIFIHGACATIGCLPMTDDIIKELYIYAIEAKNNGQNKIPVYIFPLRLNKKNYEWLNEEYKNSDNVLTFWSNIKDGYERFLSNNEELNIKVNRDGKYLFD